jgi:hypothetical protein
VLRLVSNGRDQRSDAIHLDGRGEEGGHQE